MLLSKPCGIQRVNYKKRNEYNNQKLIFDKQRQAQIWF